MCRELRNVVSSMELGYEEDSFWRGAPIPFSIFHASGTQGAPYPLTNIRPTTLLGIPKSLSSVLLCLGRYEPRGAILPNLSERATPENSIARGHESLAFRRLSCEFG